MFCTYFYGYWCIRKLRWRYFLNARGKKIQFSTENVIFQFFTFNVENQWNKVYSSGFDFSEIFSSYKSIQTKKLFAPLVFFHRSWKKSLTPRSKRGRSDMEGPVWKIRQRENYQCGDDVMQKFEQPSFYHPHQRKCKCPAGRQKVYFTSKCVCVCVCVCTQLAGYRL